MTNSSAHNVQLIESPGGEQLVMMSRSTYEHLLDQADASTHNKVMTALSEGREETLSSEEMLELLDAQTPLAFWRRKRGLTQIALGEQIGVSQSYIAGLEAGKRKGDPIHFRQLAAALAVNMEDLVIG
jgi:DNA-binding XRE family transcriptional regulator/PHD/YefM family antitoxin component YafN of YafNO toxin-antitoxin module